MCRITLCLAVLLSGCQSVPPAQQDVLYHNAAVATDHPVASQAGLEMLRKGDDPVAAITRLAGRVRQIHIKDARPADGPGCWGREMPAGQGAVDWPAFFAVSERIDPSVNYVIEREAGPDRDADVAAARAMIEKQLGEE